MKRKLCDKYLVDGKPMLAPDVDVSITENDLDDQDSGRDESGYMHRILLRPGLKTWEFSYAVLDAEDYAYIQSLFSGKTNFSFQYPDVDGSFSSTIAYSSTRSITLRNYATGEYKNLKFKIIEC